MKSNKDLIRMLNEVDKYGFLPMIVGRMISADYLTNVQNCNTSITFFENLLEVLDESELSNKEEWRERFKAGIEIAKRDKQIFENEN